MASRKRWRATSKRPKRRTDQHLRVRYLARFAPELQYSPSPLTCRHILVEAQMAGLDPRVLYEQAVTVRPVAWPVAPGYDEVMGRRASPAQPQNVVPLLKLLLPRLPARF